MDLPVNVLGENRESLEHFFQELGEQKYRAHQLMQWVYHYNCRDFAEITVFSKKLRNHLSSVATVNLPTHLETHKSHDGTVRWVLEASTGDAIETVLIPDGKRLTLCISSQAGCSLDCTFCATGKQGFNGNLSTADIVGQTFFVQDWLHKNRYPNSISNVVFMGMGEPLMNYEASMPAADIFMDDFAFGLSKRRVTISTSGVAPMIDAMVGRTEASLAVSLHAANDELRNELIPLNRKYPLERLFKSCKNYLDSLDARRNITFEYTLIKGVNDQPSHAEELINFTSNIRSKINLIPFNPFPRTKYERPTIDQIKLFQSTLMGRGVMATLRTTRGDDINAACGQLVGDVQDRTRRKIRHENLHRQSLALDVSNTIE